MRKKIFTFLLALVASVGMSWAVPTEFANCYDCWRNPDYPKTSGQCNLFNFGNPYVGNENPSGPWKLEFVEYYNSSSTEYESNIVDDYAASQYDKTPEEMEVYRLYQWQNGAYQPVAYGVLYAYANESNTVEHAAFFEANGHYGCYLTGNTHSSGDDFNITFDEDAATGFGDLHPAPAPAVIDLATITSDYVIPDGATLTGTLQNNVVLTVADNATITLSNVDINWDATWTGGEHAGITCDNATIILAECTTNKIRGFLDGNPGVYVRPDKTITIQGTGTLYAATNGGAAAIGSGYGPQNSNARDGGNIVILDGTIFATGGNLGAGIGSGGRSKVGNITIQGGIITATGGGSAAGIGCGQTKQSTWKAQCGNITITNGVKYLKATKGSGSDQCIGKGNNSGIAVCGTVTINGTTGAISTSPYTYSPAADNVKNLINAIGTVEYTTESKDKIDAARAAYDALADYSCDVDAVNALKDAVSNYSTLTDAEAAYDALEADHNAANAVIDLINAIDDPVVYTDACHQEILDAREAYNNLTQAQKDLIDASTLQKLTDAEDAYASLNVDITAKADPQNAGVYYSTFYDGSRQLQLPANVEAYTATVSGDKMLLKKVAVPGDILPAATAVVLRAGEEHFSLIPNAASPVAVGNNALRGTDVNMTVPSAHCYVLSGADGFVGFYPLSGSYMLTAHKAYIDLDNLPGGPSSAPRRLRFVFENEQTATGVEDVQSDNVQSTKVIENGVLYIIKNGVKYNAQGQIVK